MGLAQKQRVKGNKGPRGESANKKQGIVPYKDQSNDNTEKTKTSQVPERTLSRNENGQNSSSTLGLFDSVKVTDPMFKTASNGFQVSSPLVKQKKALKTSNLKKVIHEAN